MQGADKMLRLALLQLRTPDEAGAGVDAALALAERAADAGARFLLTPEASNFLTPDADRMRRNAAAESDDVFVAAMAQFAAARKVWVLLGSVLLRRPDGRIANRSLLLDASGAIRARYDKIHMFDADLPDGDVHRESDLYAAGKKAVLAATPWGALGLSICYDLRFPELHLDLARAGAAMIAIPAAFARATGAAHWEVLLRARAIETGAFILAPAQGGVHASGQGTWGRSMIVSPWGEIIAAAAGDEPCFVLGDIALDRVAVARAAVPCLRHRVPYAAPVSLAG